MTFIISSILSFATKAGPICDETFGASWKGLSVLEICIF